MAEGDVRLAGLFVFTGALGLIWSFAFRRSYRDPAEFPGVNQAEIELIRSSGGIPDLSHRISTRHAARKGSLWRDFSVVLGRRKLWGIYFGHFAWGTTSTFFLTWFPTYLVTYRHLDFIKAGFYASLPFLGAFAGVLCSGVVRLAVSARLQPELRAQDADHWRAGAVDQHRRREFRGPPALIILFLSLAFFANGLASIHWSLVSATAPERLIGLTSGVFNGVGGLAGITAPIIIGLLLRGGDFTRPLTFIACIALLGACSYIFVVGKLERVAG